jgi:hypothetical protein
MDAKKTSHRPRKKRPTVWLTTQPVRAQPVVVTPAYRRLVDRPDDSERRPWLADTRGTGATCGFCGAEYVTDKQGRRLNHNCLGVELSPETNPIRSLKRKRKKRRREMSYLERLDRQHEKAMRTDDCHVDEPERTEADRLKEGFAMLGE